MLVFGFAVMQFSSIIPNGEVEATTDFFGDIQDAWMGSRYNTLAKYPNGVLYSTAGGTNNTQVAKNNNNGQWEKTRFHKNPYGKGDDFIDFTMSNDNGFLLSDTGKVFYVGDSNNATGTFAYYPAGLYGETSNSQRHESSIDVDKIQSTGIAGQYVGNTNNSFIEHNLLTNISLNNAKIVDIAASHTSVIYLDENNRLWGIGTGYEGTYYDNILGFGTASNQNSGSTMNYEEVVDGKTYKGVKLLAENVEDFSVSFTDVANEWRSSMWFKSDGVWYATGDNYYGKTFAHESNSNYITNSQFNSGITMSNGKPMVGKKVILDTLNSTYKKSYTYSDIKQIQGYGISSGMLMNDGLLYQIGNSEYGNMSNEAGTGSQSNSTKPLLQKIVAKQEYIDRVGAGWNKIKRLFPGAHAIFVEMENGRVWAHGSNDSGDLGYYSSGTQPLLTDITEPASTGENYYYAPYANRKSSNKVYNPKMLNAGWNGTVVISSDGYIMGTGGDYGHLGTNNYEDPSLGGYGFTRIKRNNRAVRIPMILVDGDSQMENWQNNPTDIKIGQKTEYAKGSTTDYTTYAEYQIYACKDSSTAEDYLSKNVGDCTYELTGKTNKISSNTNTSKEHEVNKIDDKDLYKVDLDSLNLDGGYYQIVAKRYAFIGPTGSLSGQRQYNEVGTESEYFFEITKDPKINVETYTEIEVGTTFNKKINVTAEDSKSRDIIFGEGDYDLKNTGFVDNTKAGVYKVTYSMVDEFTGATTSVDRIVVVKDKDSVFTSTGFIGANPSYYTVNQAKKIKDEAELLDNMNAGAFDIKTAKNLNAGFDNASKDLFTNKIQKGEVGIHLMTVQANDTLSDGSQFTDTVTKMVVVNDGSIEMGEEFALQARDFEVAYQLAGGDPQKRIENLSGYKVIDLATSNDVTSTANLDLDMGTWAQVENSSHSIKFAIKSKDGLKIDVQKGITGFIDSQPHIRFSPLALEAQYGSPVDEIFKVGVTANDTDDGSLMEELRLNPETTVINNFEVGIHVVNYAVNDYHGNTDNKNRVVVMNDGRYRVGNKYIIEANDFKIRVSEVDQTPSAIASKAGIVVYDAATGENVTNDVTLDIQTGGYTDEAGDYNMRVKVVEDPTTQKDFKASVLLGGKPEISVNTKFDEVELGNDYIETTGVVATDLEDGAIPASANMDITKDTEAGVYIITYTAVDTDENSVSATRVVLVNDGTYTVGDKYLLKAEDFKLRIGEVDTANKDTQVKDLGKVQVYDKLSGVESSETVTLTYKDPVYTDEEGTYGINVAVGEDVNKDITATVETGSKPVLTIDPTFIEVTEGEGYDVTSGVSVSDSEDETITFTQDKEIKKDTEAGVYTITYTAVDTDENSVSATRVVLVNDGTYTVGDKYLLKAEDFIIGYNNWTSERKEILNLAEVELYSIKNLDNVVKVDDLSEVNIDYGTWDKEEGLSSNVTFEVASTKLRSIDVSKTIEAKVDNLPEFNFNNDVIELSETDMTEENYLRLISDFTVSDKEDGDLTSEVKITYPKLSELLTGVVYTVEYSVTDLLGNTVIVEKGMYINDGSIARVGNYLVKASDFTMYLSEYDLTEKNIEKVTGLEIYDLTGKQISLDEAEDLKIDTSKVNKKAGVYPVVFASKTGEGTLEIKATIVDNLVKTGLNNQIVITSIMLLLGLIPYRNYRNKK
ncbi:MAG: hypothetical protein ACK5NF_04690 [Bacilli bacterium]